jgi:hypothetical protein
MVFEGVRVDWRSEHSFGGFFRRTTTLETFFYVCEVGRMDGTIW